MKKLLVLLVCLAMSFPTLVMAQAATDEHHPDQAQAPAAQSAPAGEAAPAPVPAPTAPGMMGPAMMDMMKMMMGQMMEGGKMGMMDRMMGGNMMKMMSGGMMNMMGMMGSPMGATAPAGPGKGAMDLPDLSKLNLEPAQWKQVRDLAYEKAKQTQQLASERDLLNIESTYLLGEEEPDLEKLKKIFARIGEIDLELLMAGKSYLQGLQQVLTPEQMKKMNM